MTFSIQTQAQHTLSATHTFIQPAFVHQLPICCAKNECVKREIKFEVFYVAVKKQNHKKRAEKEKKKRY